MKHVMLDLETLGTTADSVILSIGAVLFDLDAREVAKDGFYASISIDSNQDAGRRISEDSLLWWLKQPAAAQQVFHEAKVTLEDALTDLSDWLGHDNRFVWAKGPSFDIAMLEHAYKSFHMDPPWKFWNARCVRTYAALPGASAVKATDLGAKHNALSDAYSQAEHVVNIHQALFAPPAKTKAKAK